MHIWLFKDIRFVKLETEMLAYDPLKSNNVINNCY